MTLRAFFLSILALSVIFFATQWTARFSGPQEQPSGVAAASKPLQAQEGIYGLASAHPFATRAGLEILQKGGTAVDASVAVVTMLTLVEPQSSGIGGGGFMLHWDATTKKLHAYDGREKAPASARPDQFLDAEGRPAPFYDAVVGGRSVGVPGIMAALKMAHDRHGGLPWTTLFAPAIHRATEGFPISKRLHGYITYFPKLREIPGPDTYFFDAEGKPHPVGHVLRNPDYALTLRKLAREGVSHMYEGELTDEIIATVGKAVHPAVMTRRDFSSYSAIERDPVCQKYQMQIAVKVCSFPPPSSGGPTMLNILNIIEALDGSYTGTDDPAWLHDYLEASRLAYADRALYLADPAFLKETIGVDSREIVAGMINKDYGRLRASLIKPDAAQQNVAAGNPLGFGKVEEELSPHSGFEPPSTSHFSIRDKYGNVVSLTVTIESSFGSHHMAGGFFLNNELTDFSFLPEKEGKLIANAVAPNKRPRSSMTPSIIFDEAGDPIVAIGSPGGPNIIGYVAKSVLGIFKFNLPVQEAINLPNISTARGRQTLEEGRFSDETIQKLKAMGHDIRVGPLRSGITGIRWDAQTITGGADQRGEGLFQSSTEEAPAR